MAGVDGEFAGGGAVSGAGRAVAGDNVRGGYHDIGAGEVRVRSRPAEVGADFAFERGCRFGPDNIAVGFFEQADVGGVGREFPLSMRTEVLALSNSVQLAARKSRLAR